MKYIHWYLPFGNCKSISCCLSSKDPINFNLNQCVLSFGVSLVNESVPSPSEETVHWHYDRSFHQECLSTRLERWDCKSHVPTENKGSGGVPGFIDDLQVDSVIPSFLFFSSLRFVWERLLDTESYFEGPFQGES